MSKITLHDDRNVGLCPVCSGDRSKLTAALRSSELYECCGCGHRFISLASLPVELESLYGSEYAGFRSDSVFQAVIREEIASNFIPRIPPPGRILDVGCGNGEFLAAAGEAGYIATGIDTSPTAVAHCENRGLNAQVGDFVNLRTNGEFDFTTMWDVIEHLPGPQAFVQRAFELLRPGGYLAIKTPCNTARTVQVVRAFLRLAGGLLHVPSHIQFFDRHTLWNVASG